jgi:AcrR family transcriptional regulator
MPTTRRRTAPPRTTATAAAEPAQATAVRRENILRAAEQLFAERGYHGVSIRDIAEEAGVPLALVGYHFGPKLQLYHALFRQRAGYGARRLQALAEACAQPAGAARLRAIVEAFVQPALILAETPDGRRFLRIMARGITEQLQEDDAVIRELFDPLAHAFIDALATALAPARRATVAWCYQFALGALLHHVVDLRIERLSRGINRAGDGATAGPLLVRFIVAGLQAACTSEETC